MTRALRFLVVDDEPDARAFMAIVLRSLGHEVALAGDGHEALALAAGAERFDAVLMDLQMPGIDGLEATRRLRGLPATRDGAIVFVSAKTSDQTRAAALAAGGDVFLTKPCHDDAILAGVEAVLRRRGRLAPGERIA